MKDICISGSTERVYEFFNFKIEPKKKSKNLNVSGGL